MLDIWIADIALLLAAVIYPVQAIYRSRPRYVPGDPQGTVTASEREYRRRYYVRLVLFRFMAPMLTLYFIFRAATWPSDAAPEGPGVAWLACLLYALYVPAIIGAIALRVSQERAFVRIHPSFADSLLPLRARVGALLPFIVAIGCIVSCTAFNDIAIVGGLYLTGLVSALLGRRLQMRTLTKSRHELAWDEPLGARIAEVLEQFGVTPKKLILYPSMMPNAFALPDGSVLVTSALRTLATKEEVAAVVAHELSHVRDGEGKKIQQRRLLSFLPVLLFLVATFMLVPSSSTEVFLPPIVCFGCTSVWTLSLLLFGQYTRRIEFKCDKDAARLGLGPSLASALEKINLFVGNPRRWAWLDRYILSHPSLDERLAALQEV
jgi:Zn-dependent protease with chaperone function